MDKTWPLYGPNNFTINGILLFNMHYSPVKIWAISGIQKQRYCRNSKIMDLIWPKHGPNMVLLIKHNIDMSLGPICLSPESFISLVSLESQLKVRLVNCPLTDRQMDTTNSRVVPHWGGNKKLKNQKVELHMEWSKFFALDQSLKCYSKKSNFLKMQKIKKIGKI